MTFKIYLFINFRDYWKFNFIFRNLIIMLVEFLLVELIYYIGEFNYILDIENFFVVKFEEFM